MKDEVRAAWSGVVDGSIKGGILASAGSIVSGAALATVPTTTKILFVTVATGSTTAVAWPAVAMFGLGGAVIGGTVAGASAYRRVRKIEQEWREVLQS